MIVGCRSSGKQKISSSLVAFRLGKTLETVLTIAKADQHNNNNKWCSFLAEFHLMINYSTQY